MCGEIDENLLVNQELLERFALMANMLRGAPKDGLVEAPKDLDKVEGRAAYMEAIFQQGLNRAVTDAHAASDDEVIDAIASQAIALARLAGFIAGQLPPDADLFRAVIEAVTAGQSETAILSRQYRDAQSAAHGHDSHGENGSHHH